MAIPKSTTKALKAKVTQRAALKRKTAKKSKITCSVVAALKGQAQDIDRYNALCQEWRKAPAGDRKDELADRCRAIRDVISGRWEAISYLHPQSLDGAIYLLLVGYADFDGAHEITDNDLRAKQQRRACRCLEKALDRIWHLPAAHADVGIRQWLMPFDNTQWSRLFYARLRADEAIEARKAGAS
jgi:hypothetical protein